MAVSDSQGVSGTSADGAAADEIISLLGIAKSYGYARVLRGVDFAVRGGEVHALLGGNGAGKSTLIKCLAGAEQPTAGQILVDGTETRFDSPADGIAAGVAVVYQELSLFPTLTVSENLLGAHGTGTWVGWHEMHRQARRHLEQLGINLDPKKKIEDLPVGEQQMIEIARAFFSRARVVVLDEPTSALSAIEEKVLFTLMRQLTARGVGIVLVTHTLEDALEHAERVTVLRDGQMVFTSCARDTSREELVRRIVGQERADLAQSYAGEVTLQPRATGEILLRAHELTLLPNVRRMSLDVREGEILALYGHVGAGHVEAAELLFGLAKPAKGEVQLRGGTSVISSPPQARASGVGFIPMDRRDGLALEQSVAKNMTLAKLHTLQGMRLRPRDENRLVQKMIERVNVAGAYPTKATGLLSGGNQQKVLFARWLIGQRPDVLVLVEPTRGMDVAAKAAVLGIVRELANQGTGIVIVSSETETVLAIAHRILVVKRGEIVAEVAETRVNKEFLMEKAS